MVEKDMKNLHLVVVALLGLSAGPLLASPRSDLESSSQATRDAAAEVLREACRPPPESTWRPLLDSLVPGTPKATALERIERFSPAYHPELMLAMGPEYRVVYRLDDLWTLACIFRTAEDTRIKCTLGKWLRIIRAEPPEGFSGTWTLYFANGRKSHEIQYRDEKYHGTLKAFRPDGSKQCVQHYDAGTCEMDTGYYPSGRQPEGRDGTVLPGNWGRNQRQVTLIYAGFRRLQDSKIEALQLSPLFKGIFVDAIDEPDHLGKQGLFEHILTKNRLAPSEVLVVGDNADSEIAVGDRLGMATVQTLRPGVPRTMDATYHIKSLGELQVILNSV